MFIFCFCFAAPRVLIQLDSAFTAFSILPTIQLAMRSQDLAKMGKFKMEKTLVAAVTNRLSASFSSFDFSDLFPETAES